MLQKAVLEDPHSWGRLSRFHWRAAISVLNWRPDLLKAKTAHGFLLPHAGSRGFTAPSARSAAELKVAEDKADLVLLPEGSLQGQTFTDAGRTAIAASIGEGSRLGTWQPLPGARDSAKGILYEGLDLLNGPIVVSNNIQHRVGWEVPLLPELHQSLTVPQLNLHSPKI